MRSMVSTGVPPPGGKRQSDGWNQMLSLRFIRSEPSFTRSFTRKRAAKGPTETSRCTLIFQEPRISARLVCGLLDPTEKAASPDPSFSASVIYW